MIKKIADLLGEELAQQVEEKLGEVELAVMNDGTVVPVSKYDKVKEDLKNLETNHRTELEEINKKLTDAMKNSGDAEKFKADITKLQEDHKKAVEDYEGKLQKIKIDSLMDLELTKAGAKNLTAVKALLDKEKIELKDDNLTGLSEQLEGLKTSDEYLFGKIEKAGGEAHKSKENNITTRQNLIDQYNAAEKIGDVGAMLVLDEQIKNMKE